ncbi:hypothetical protein E2562_036965 [Oryza meyeriana var. granulata]|uniref:Uncharacterized protein n=1 Tax=Oryza meyeriana var. granulata TaxID=110450 RepID=A0A6G1ETQ0_9ORYZ|nr:hypothetical protein E2562_036965 [Oryza meyeriana var. granulata]
MAWSYVKMSMFGTAATYSNDDEIIIAAVAVLIQTPQKRPWGGSVPGHKTYKRDRLAADWQLNQDYFVERPLYSEEHFRRRCYWTTYGCAPTAYKEEVVRYFSYQVMVMPH